MIFKTLVIKVKLITFWNAANVFTMLVLVIELYVSYV